MNPLSLLVSGGKRVGGLLGSGLKAAGRNFDANAAGPLPELLGADFTPAMRSSARSNALMAIGQHLQGSQPISQGLQQGQARLFDAWQTKQALQQQRQAQQMMQGLTQDMAQGGSPTLPAAAGGDGPTQAPDPASALRSRAQQYRSIGSKLVMVGKHEPAKIYFDQAEKFDARADALQPKPMGNLQQVTGPDGKPAMAVLFSDGKVRIADNAKPPAQWVVMDLGGKSQLINTAGEMPQTSYDKTATADAILSNNRQQTEFEKMFPLQERRTAAQEMGARASATGANASMMNANTAAARETRESKEGKPLSGEASKVLAIASTMQPEIDALAEALQTGGRAAIMGIKTRYNMPLTRLAESVADKVGRLRSGGAINKEEEARFMRQIVSFADLRDPSASGAVEALARLRKEAEAVARGVNPHMVQPPAGGMPNITITPIK